MDVKIIHANNDAVTQSQQLLEHVQSTTGRPDAFRRAAHSLKSNANTFGATKLGTLARDLELTGVPAGGGAAELDALAREYERVSVRLQELRRA